MKQKVGTLSHSILDEMLVRFESVRVASCDIIATHFVTAKYNRPRQYAARKMIETEPSTMEI